MRGDKTESYKLFNYNQRREIKETKSKKRKEKKATTNMQALFQQYQESLKYKWSKYNNEKQRLSEWIFKKTRPDYELATINPP